MKNPKTRTLNLATMTEAKLLNMIKNNNMEAAELFAILESLFEMFSCSLKFSHVVMHYGHENIPNFIPTFLEHAAHAHGMSPQKLVDILQQPSIH